MWYRYRTATVKESVRYLSQGDRHLNANERESVVEKLIGAIYEVSNVLGAGFLEKVYERALLKELASVGLYARPKYDFQSCIRVTA